MWGEATDKAGKWWISVGPNLRKVAWACHINKKRKRGVQIKSFRVGVGGKLEGGEYSHWSVCTFVFVPCSVPFPCVCVCVLRWGGRWSMFSKWISDEGLRGESISGEMVQQSIGFDQTRRGGEVGCKYFKSGQEERWRKDFWTISGD